MTEQAKIISSLAKHMRERARGIAAETYLPTPTSTDGRVETSRKTSEKGRESTQPNHSAKRS